MLVQHCNSGSDSSAAHGRWQVREAGAGGRALGQGNGEACAGGCSPQF
jgi:hypothetical protein